MKDMHIEKLPPSSFPPLLQEITDPPEALYIIGEYPDVETHVFLAVVGSRKYTTYGKEVVSKLIGELRGLPVVIVSGLALGIDALAHKAALDAGLITIGVPGSGLGKDVIYPATNRRLAQQIVEKGGCLLSEYEPDTIAAPWMFPQRNRIMAGITYATLVIEATERSGTLITARLAMEYNRDVLTVPGSIFSPTSRGPHYLIQNGATPITSSADLIEALDLEKDEGASTQQLFATLSSEEQAVVELLHEPQSVDELIQALDMPIHKAQALLTSMEIKGIIKQTLGKYSLRA